MTKTFGNTSAKSGEIAKSGFLYSVDTATALPVVGQDLGTGAEERSYFSFDTSSLPNNSIISKVEFMWWVNGTSSSGLFVPSSWRTNWAMGTFIDAALDAGDWNGGTFVYQHVGTPAAGATTLDLSLLGIPFVNVKGDTDVRVYDTSLSLGGSWVQTLTKSRTTLTVTYEVALIRYCKVFQAKIYNGGA